MSDEGLRDLARECGLAVDWIDAAAQPRQVSVGSLSAILDALGLPCATPQQRSESLERVRRIRADRPLVTATVGDATPLATGPDGTSGELELESGERRPLRIANLVPPIDQPGYHRLRFAGREVQLAVAPPRCVTLANLAPGRRLWGLAVQLYSLARPGDGGIGDTTALTALARQAAAFGADAVALSPTHSLFPADPGRYGPYSPSSRLFLNPLLADPAALFDAKRIAALGDAPDGGGRLIDWPRAGGAKYALLRRLFDDFAHTDLSARTTLADDFHVFVRQGGSALQSHANFEAQQAGTPLAYHLFLQWIADRAFAAVQTEARAAGMRIGIISDLAIGVDRAGGQVAAQPDDFLAGLSIGAPPDFFNPRGQDWGLTSFSPWTLAARGYEPFIATLRAAMQHAGGVRIDHAMGLMRLWLVPAGAPASEGAYLAYPLDDLLRLLALESHRHNAVVIGEDLGTVPPEFRTRCREAGIAGMDVLWFQRDEKRFLAPAEWRGDAVGMTSTHDLPTVAGWWRGVDLAQRRAFDLVRDDEFGQRPRDRTALWRAFADASAATGPQPKADEAERAVDAACAFVAQAPGPLTLLPLEDVTGTVEQPNLPGTVDAHPNWRRRFDLPAADLLRAPAVARRLKTVNDRRR